ncbi:hypothetical protein VIGAN_06025300 [Vigna angularis var. angularis]|uniref:Uncharacterized protein n=1 Tax=Vigna angularis var. angularis TaxID=157739 RepID=A0A0S3S924_PHAAN|nr:hypothetical protein VIGAN_06025300 [Vigna angularis var. angularis]
MRGPSQQNSNFACSYVICFQVGHYLFLAIFLSLLIVGWQTRGPLPFPFSIEAHFSKTKETFSNLHAIYKTKPYGPPSFHLPT